MKRPALAVIGLVLTSSVVAQTPAPEYTIKETESPRGSAIRRDVVWGSPLPINKRYDELTAEQRQSLNGLYESIGPRDEPPFPAEGLKPIHQAMAQAQQKLLVSGELILFATVAADGTVTEVKALGSPSPEMVKFASSVLLLTKFKPALCQGEPCRMDYPFRFEFTVRR